jgi:hypothetical protein
MKITTEKPSKGYFYDCPCCGNQYESDEPGAASICEWSDQRAELLAAAEEFMAAEGRHEAINALRAAIAKAKGATKAKGAK